MFSPLNSYTNSAENTENPESRFYSLTMQREVGNYLFEVGYSGSRGSKGINQVHLNPVDADGGAGGDGPRGRHRFRRFSLGASIPRGACAR